MEFFFENGNRVQLGRFITSGGEGEINELQSDNTLLVKTYKPEVAHRAAARMGKLKAMVQNLELKSKDWLAWPQSLIVDERRQVVGFTMKRVRGESLVPLSALKLLHKRFPGWTRVDLCCVVYQIADALNVLAAHGALPGDISLSNFLADPTSRKVSFIDCDSYQFTSNGKVFPCDVLTPELAAPEVLNLPGQFKTIGPEQVRFSAGILFFYILTHGGHPYQAKGSASPIEDIKRGRVFMGGAGTADAFTTPEIFNRYTALSPFLMKLFKQTFIAGHKDPSARPPFSEWVKAAQNFGEDLQQHQR